jgi:hypothetical protein
MDQKAKEFVRNVEMALMALGAILFAVWIMSI